MGHDPQEVGLVALIGALCAGLGAIIRIWSEQRKALREVDVEERQQEIAERQEERAALNDAETRTGAWANRFLDLQIAFDKHMERAAAERTQWHETERAMRQEHANCETRHLECERNRLLDRDECRKEIHALARQIGDLRQTVRDRTGERILAEAAHLQTITDAAADIFEAEQRNPPYPSKAEDD